MVMTKGLGGIESLAIVVKRTVVVMMRSKTYRGLVVKVEPRVCRR
jgi:hypothetical protein